MSGKLDELSLQRLVDGAMNEPERREFLRGLNGDPQNWREVALAFVEEQVWRQTIGDADSLENREQHRETTKTVSETSYIWLKTALMVAACLLLTLTIGFQWGRQTRPDRIHGTPIVAEPQNTGSENTTAEHAPPQSPPATDQQAPTYRLQLTALGADGEHTLELPVFERPELDLEAWQPHDRETIELLNRDLAKQGYRIDRQTDFLSGQMNDGRHVVVPIHQTSLQYAIQ